MSNMTPFLKMDESRRKPNNTTTVKECDSSSLSSELTRFYTDILHRRVKAQENIMRNFFIFKNHNPLNISNQFFIHCECNLQCMCYTDAQKPRLSIHMCLRKEELDWLYLTQPFAFSVQIKCDICDKELNCGQKYIEL